MPKATYSQISILCDGKPNVYGQQKVNKNEKENESRGWIINKSTPELKLTQLMLLWQAGSLWTHNALLLAAGQPTLRLSERR